MSGLGLASGSGGAMSPETARRLAALITADAQQLEERAQEQGVTAFLGRAVKRERPNERFLQNTLRNLASANKRKEEKAMWSAWQAEQEQQQEPQLERQQDRQQSLRGSQQQQERQAAPKGPARQHGDYNTRAREPGAGGKRTRSQSPGRSYSRKSRRRRSRSPYGRAHSRGRGRSSSCERHQSSRRAGQSPPQHGASPPGPAGHEATQQPAEALPNGRDDQDWSDGDAGVDQQLLQWLAGSKAVKGRGSIGPHADVTGPYLPAPQNPEQLKEGSAKGPPKPSWLQGSGEGDVRMKPNAAFLRGVLAAQGVATVRGRGQPSKAGGGGSGSTDSSSSSESSSSSSSDSKRQRERKRSTHKREGSSKQHKKHKKAKKAKKKNSKHRRQ